MNHARCLKLGAPEKKGPCSWSEESIVNIELVDHLRTLCQAPDGLVCGWGHAAWHSAMADGGTAANGDHAGQEVELFNITKYL
jgi:hypothetical protein